MVEVVVVVVVVIVVIEIPYIIYISGTVRHHQKLSMAPTCERERGKIAEKEHRTKENRRHPEIQ